MNEIERNFMTKIERNVHQKLEEIFMTKIERSFLKKMRFFLDLCKDYPNVRSKLLLVQQINFIVQ